MKMKTVFLVLLAAALVLSLTGVAAAAESKVPINNKTLFEEDNMIEVPVNITLNLANDYVVTIPADFSLTTVDLTNNEKLYTTDRQTPPIIDVDVLLLKEGQYINVSLLPADAQYYNSSYDAGIANSQVGYDEGDGAWKFVSGGNILHYVISNGSSFITADGYDAGVLEITTSKSDNFISLGESIVYTNKSVDVPIHVAVMDKPKVVAAYTSMLKFVVKLDGAP